ncbi:MAG: GPR endopeptidase, partial [Firmicutes bacterium]|nr:GPR endopeptidase [Bacillota bacterium]
MSVDLALEAHELARGRTGREIPGVAVHRETFPQATVTTVRVLDERAESVMGKPRGTYVTIEAPALRENNRQAHREIVKTFGARLASLLRIGQDA